jgi:hypothetical protein
MYTCCSVNASHFTPQGEFQGDGHKMCLAALLRALGEETGTTVQSERASVATQMVL